MRKAVLCLAILSLASTLRAQTETNAPAATAPADDADKKARQALVDAQVVAASPSVFAGDQFPKIDFVNKDLIRRALGPYTLSVRYFAADWSEVTQPGAQGRYGALVKIDFPDGISDTRQLTLFHTAKDYSPAKDPYVVSLHFPSEFGLPAGIGEKESWNVGKYVNDTFDAARAKTDDYALFLAALHDIASDPARFRGYEFWRVDNMWWQELEKRQGMEIPYQKTVRVPEGYDQSPTKKWPLILFLHGSGERGDDISILKRWGPGGYEDAGHPLPFIIVTPQCRKRERWNPSLLVPLLAEIGKNYRVDTSRIYLTGLSMGGIGVVDLAAAYPKKFAALACLSGREDPEIAPRLHGIPAWFFHGADDETVPARFSVELAEALRKQGGPVKLTLIPGVGHGQWDKVYADPALYAWFLQYQL
jgi:predicted esterase